ncbi:rCG28586 [Rattus norvegicus]|uniref:RCG28586 n=1 Tax=Rattus norvegicus TaxID=10116 RepID=A6HV88_RAT|nr:rCG28586 [Rattus norvegicus]
MIKISQATDSSWRRKSWCSSGIWPVRVAFAQWMPHTHSSHCAERVIKEKEKKEETMTLTGDKVGSGKS